MKKPSQDELETFVKVAKEELTKRLNAVNLDLMDMGLQYGPVVKGEQTYVICGWVERKIACQVKEFQSTIGIQAGVTDSEAVQPLVKEIARQMIAAFYESNPKVAVIH